MPVTFIFSIQWKGLQFFDMKNPDSMGNQLRIQRPVGWVDAAVGLGQ
jgi:hypothetical protein